MSSTDSRPGPSTEAKPRPRWLIGGGALFVGLLTLGVMVATEPKLAIVWDEGFTLGREARIRLWLAALRDPAGFAAHWVPPSPRAELVQQDQRPLPPPRRDEIDTTGKLLGPRAMAYFWPFAREEPHGHPPFYAIVGLLGDAIAPSWEVLPRARIGPMVAFSLAGAALFGFAAGRWGLAAGALAAGAWLLQPNLFGHGHYATLDGLLASLWVGAVLAFARAVEATGRWGRWSWTVGFGVLCGWAAATKLTGWFLPIPFVVWALWDRNGRAARILAVAGVVGLATLFLFNPCWWNHPVSGVERFFRSNLTRAQTIPIPVEFLGWVYDTPRESLPWYNTVAWTVLVTPVGFLALALLGAGLGAVTFARRWWPRRDEGGPVAIDAIGVLALMHWGFLLLLRAMPHTPGHDGVRLFLPAFGMLALVAAWGAAAVARWSPRGGRAVVGLALAEGVASVALLMPTPLAYFSPLVGGPPGAARLGMEPTYFWDGLSDEAIAFLNANTPPGRSVQFATFPTSWLYLQQTGKLRVPFSSPLEPRRAAFYVVQNRPGALSPADRDLIARGRPAFQVSKFGVPLILIYPLP